jgi:predicted component of type VI protein secretion system
MKTFNASNMFRICIILLALGFMVSGCATSAQLQKLQAQVDEVSLKADNAMNAAVAGQKVAEDCRVNADKAIVASNQAIAASNQAIAASRQAIAGADRAAERAENAAAKAEAVFMKHMKK